MIKAVILDFGNVICSFTNDHFLNKLSAINGKQKSENLKLIYKISGLPKKYETGLISSDEFFESLSKLCDLNISYEELRKIYTDDKFTPIPGMAEIIKSLKSNYKLALLSNTSEWDTEYGINLIPEIKLLDTITLSYEVKAMKPSPEIYYDALTKLNLSPQECIYTDDILDYVKAAQNIGINGIQFTNPENFKSSLNKFGVEIK